jgi:hypothetical protein
VGAVHTHNSPPRRAIIHLAVFETDTSTTTRRYYAASTSSIPTSGDDGSWTLYAVTYY